MRDISARSQHPQWLYNLIVTGREALLGWQTAGLPEPKGTKPRQDPATARLFQRDCATCHGGPGTAPASFALSLNPAAPPLSAIERPAAEILWLIRNGLKLSAMPAWEDHLSEAEMRALTGFVRALPGISPSEYRSLAGLRWSSPESTLRPGSGDTGPGDPVRGRRLTQGFGCRRCHLIPGLPGDPAPRIGPPLTEVAARGYLGGVLANQPGALAHWLRAPQHFSPGSAMPDLGLGPRQAADIAAFLLTVSGPGRKPTAPD
ncbi:c-type cytochrome [Frigidibacter sp. MR17.24]|uniref:c-type cytochrome n=1 Tax=Frigidibacter sp. MR17.24 TaxID=3127345 RepID=UPI003012E46A